MNIRPILSAAFLLMVPHLSLAQEHRRTIEIPLAVSAAKAGDVVRIAALRGGWGVKSSDGGVITLDTFTPKEAGALNVSLRANVVGSDSTATVVVTGLWGSKVRSNGEPTEAIDAGPFSRFNKAGPVSWAELERFADAIKAATK